MSVQIVLGTKAAFDTEPSFENGRLKVGSGKHLDRVKMLRLNLQLRPEAAGTQPTALLVEAVRDASQGAAADLLAFQAQFASGRAEKSVFPMVIFLVDDHRNGKVAPIGKFVCEKTVIVGTDYADDNGPPEQAVTFRVGKFSYFNLISGQEEPNDPTVSPVEIHGFDERPNAAG
jgi:hypothetical protein